MVTQISLGLTVVLICILTYFIIRPEKILTKNPHLTSKKLRIRLGIGLFLALVALGLKLPGLMKPASSSDSQSATMEKFFRDRLARYDDDSKTRSFTKSCVPFQFMEVRKAYLQLSEEIVKLAAEETCSCMATYLRDMKEFAQVEAALGEGKDYETAMNTFMDTNVMMEKAKPCMEQ